MDGDITPNLFDDDGVLRNYKTIDARADIRGLRVVRDLAE